MTSRRRSFEWHIPLLAGLLVVIGVLFLGSATATSPKLSSLPRKQIVYLLAGLPLFLLALRVPYLDLVRWSTPIFAVIGVVLVLLLLVGPRIEGARRWVVLPGGYVLQPSEFAKIAVILALAKYLRFRTDQRTFVGLLKALTLPVPIILLIVLEPDLGTALAFVPVTLLMVYVSGARLRHLLILGAIALAAVPVAWFGPFLHDYQKSRVLAFLSPIDRLERERADAREEHDEEEARRLAERILELKRGAGYQQYHSMIAFGSGGKLGAGLGQGPHCQLRYLPESHADFIFAVIGEEWGLVGTSITLFVYLLLGWLLLSIAYRARERAGRLIGVGVAMLLVLQAFINMAMTVGLLPITGLTLPFVSAGGSSLWSCMLGLGLALNVSYNPCEME